MGEGRMEYIRTEQKPVRNYTNDIMINIPFALIRTNFKRLIHKYFPFINLCFENYFISGFKVYFNVVTIIDIVDNPFFKEP